MTGLFALATGTLVADPQRREGAKGPFATASLRVVPSTSAQEDGGEAVLVSVIAFGAEGERLLEHRKGAALAISGRARLTAWTGKDGTARHGLSLVAEQIAAAKPRRGARDAGSGRTLPSPPRPGSPRHRAPYVARTRDPAPADDGRPFDDGIADLYARSGP